MEESFSNFVSPNFSDFETRLDIVPESLFWGLYRAGRDEAATA
jgi:hypothetical protein